MNMKINAIKCIFQFDSDYLEFRSQIETLRQMIQNFMDTWFSRSLTVSHIFKVRCKLCSEIKRKKTFLFMKTGSLKGNKYGKFFVGISPTLFCLMFFIESVIESDTIL